MFTLKEILNLTGGRSAHKDSGIAIKNISIDSRTINPKDLFIALKGNNFDGHDFIRAAISRGASCVIASDKVLIDRLITEFKCSNLDFPIIGVKDTLKALTDLAGYNRRRFPVPIIAITGTNGKTTTKDMTASILSADYNVLSNEGTQNNGIGVALSLLKLNKNHDIAVLEFGTNHPGEIKALAKIAHPNIGVITNVGAGHLEFFLNIKNVFKEKSSLLKSLDAPAVGIINKDDLYLSDISGKKTFSFGVRDKSDLGAGRIIYKNNRLNFVVNKKYKFTLNSVVWHNVYNALAALSCGLIFGVDINKAEKILSEFRFPSSRLNILTLKNVTILDDTYNSNPASLRVAIEALTRYPASSRRILVMGDMLELGRNSINLHKSIGRVVSRSDIDCFISVGDLSKHAAKAAKQSYKSFQTIKVCKSCDEAIDVLRGIIKKGDVILIKGSRAMQMERIVKKLKIEG